MSAQLKQFPIKKLRVTARFEHETLNYEGNVFDFIEMIIEKGWVGRGTFSARNGSVYGLEFDMRDRIVENSLDSKGE